MRNPWHNPCSELFDELRIVVEKINQSKRSRKQAKQIEQIKKEAKKFNRTIIEEIPPTQPLRIHSLDSPNIKFQFNYDKLILSIN